MIKIAVCNRKGGIGKTTSTINIGACLAKDYGKRVLLVECDSQRNMSDYLMNHEDVELVKTFDDVFRGDYNVIHPVKFYDSRRKLIDTNISLVGACHEMEFIYPTGEDFQHIYEFFKSIENDYDICLMDCPPSTSNYVFASWLVADYILVPLEAKKDSLKGYERVVDELSRLKQEMDSSQISVKILGSFVNNYNKQNLENKVWYEVFSTIVGLKPFNTIISKSSVIGNASMDGRPVVYYQPKSKTADEYRMLCKEILKRLNNK